jgi:amino-acid N-acetyltransferase
MVIDVAVRKATAADQWKIRWMVFREGIDPTALHWSHFLVAEHAGSIVGIGQIRPSANELGSLAVSPAYRRQGVGGKLIQALIQQVDGDVYLECAATLVPYYARHGFTEISPQQAPPALRRKALVGGRVAKVFGQRLAVMKRPYTPIPE